MQLAADSSLGGVSGAELGRILLLMPDAHREAAVEMKPTADKWCIIEIKGQGDVLAPLFILTTATDVGGWPLRPEIVTFKPAVIRPALIFF